MPFAVFLLLVAAAALYLLLNRRGASGIPSSVPDPRGRRHIEDQSAESAITAIDDPLTGAATLTAIVATAEGWPKVHKRIEDALAGFTNPERAREAITFAEWAARQGVNEDRAVNHLCRFLTDRLDPPERAEVVAMVRDAGRAGGSEAERLSAKAVERLPLT